MRRGATGASSRGKAGISGGPTHRDSWRQDFEWAFGLNRRSLRLMGIWPEDATATERRLPRIPLMVAWLLLGLLLPQMYALSRVLHELPLVLDNLTTSCAALTSAIKLLFLWSRRHVIGGLVASVMSDYSRPQSAAARATLRLQARRARLFTISGYAIMSACFVGFVAAPFFGLSIRTVNNLTDSPGERFMPLQTYYPYDWQSSPCFELTYASQVLASLFVGVSFSVPDNFFGALVFHAGAQCEILSGEFARLLPAGSADHAALFRAELRRLVRLHVRLIKFVDDLESSFHLSILVQALCLSLVICCLGFAVINSLGHPDESPHFVQIATLVATLLNLMAHMLVYCIASEILAQNSLGFSHAVYSCEWYCLPANESRDIVPVIMRSRNPLRLSAGKFFYLSLNAYLKILKSSAGYISMLLAVTN